ncbi:hypothetical protein [[Clostridium] polysaccharolyticum]|uniref:Uncharacterized protein n=1 Tax=[Clostridium] polysaccharolyticum TaxID=29364 RepID=A0A1I0CGJ3_9FIRM|nr:hypothetical protein [[Clostridium] polysaccharolyticum]SET18697.1 hypothetical protein SAMN04487772_1106 [[Clostridium] polysaccharolyticum]
MSSFEAAAQSKFDKNAVMNWELYISSVLKGYGIQVNDDEAFLYKDYLTLINLFKNSQFDFNKVYNFGLFLYEYYGLDKDSAVEQVLMDMLQNNFEFVYDYTYLVERFQNLECFFYLDFRNYLENQGVTEYNSLIKYYMENYILSFESFASGLQKSKLAKIYEEGKMFYSQFGIEDNALKEKIEDDIEMYFINAVCE